MSARRILVLMDNRLDSNWGSSATTHTLFALLAAANPWAEIRGVPRSAARPESGLMRRICEAVAPRAAIAGDWSGPLRSKILRELTEKMVADLGWADLIVVNGEGTLHPQKQCRRWMPVISALPAFSTAPIWVVNCTIQVCGSGWENLWKAALGKAERIVVREPASLREVKRLGLGVEQGADCAFVAEGAPSERINEIISAKGIRRPYAVLTGSAVAEKWPITSQKAVVSLLRDYYGLDVVYASSTQEDVTNYQRLGIDCTLITEREADFQEIIGIVREASLLVGGRFHPIVFAARVGTPFVCFGSNSHKMAGLMEMLGTEHRLVDVAQEANVRKAIDKALACKSLEQDTMVGRSQRLAELARVNASRPGCG